MTKMNALVTSSVSVKPPPACLRIFVPYILVGPMAVEYRF